MKRKDRWASSPESEGETDRKAARKKQTARVADEVKPLGNVAAAGAKDAHKAPSVERYWYVATCGDDHMVLMKTG